MASALLEAASIETTLEVQTPGKPEPFFDESGVAKTRPEPRKINIATTSRMMSFSLRQRDALLNKRGRRRRPPPRIRLVGKNNVSRPYVSLERHLGAFLCSIFRYKRNQNFDPALARNLFGEEGPETASPENAVFATMAPAMITVKNVPASSESCPNCGTWMDHWRKVSGERMLLCSNIKCRERATEGGHVQIEGKGHVFIVPVCRECIQLTTPFDIPRSTRQVPANIAQSCGRLRQEAGA